MGKSKKRKGAPKYRPRKRLLVSRQSICDQYADQLNKTWMENYDMAGLDHSLFMIVNGADGPNAHPYASILAGLHWENETAHELISDVLENFDEWGNKSYPYIGTIEAFVNGMLKRLRDDAHLDVRVMDTAIVAAHPEGAAAFGYILGGRRTPASMRAMIRRALDLKTSLENR